MDSVAPGFQLILRRRTSTPEFPAAKDLEPVEPAKAQKVAYKFNGVNPEPLVVGSPQKVGLPRKTQKAKSLAMLDPWSLATGQTGVLGTAGAGGRFMVSLKVVSIVDGSDLIVEYEGAKPYWLKGFSTKGVVDDDQVRIPWVVNVTGTKTYTTARGANSTVLLIEPRLETDEERQAKERATQSKQEDNQKRDELEPQQKAAAEKARWRVWTDASRTHTVEAQFKGMIGDQVKLVKRDGTETSIPLEKLSEEDQEWIRQRSKR